MRSRASREEQRAGKGTAAKEGKGSKTFAFLVAVTYENTARGCGLKITVCVAANTT